MKNTLKHNYYELINKKIKLKRLRTIKVLLKQNSNNKHTTVNKYAVLKVGWFNFNPDLNTNSTVIIMYLNNVLFIERSGWMTLFYSIFYWKGTTSEAIITKQYKQ